MSTREPGSSIFVELVVLFRGGRGGREWFDEPKEAPPPPPPLSVAPPEIVLRFIILSVPVGTGEGGAAIVVAIVIVADGRAPGVVVCSHCRESWGEVV